MSPPLQGGRGGLVIIFGRSAGGSELVARRAVPNISLCKARFLAPPLLLITIAYSLILKRNDRKWPIFEL